MPFVRNFVAPVIATALFVLTAVGSTGAAQEGLVSSMELIPGVTAIDGIRVVPAADIPGKIYTEDYAISQVLEIIRPDGRPISVGRLATSCGCLRASMEKRSFGQGERALIEVRNVKASPPQGATFAVFVQLVSPYRSTLQYEHFTISTRKPGDPVPAAAEENAPVAAPAEPAAEVTAPVAEAPAPVEPATDPADGDDATDVRFRDIVPYGSQGGKEGSVSPADAATDPVVKK